jgi:hypothetical protein
MSAMSTSMMSRHAAGSPNGRGGQFAAHKHGVADVCLGEEYDPIDNQQGLGRSFPDPGAMPAGMTFI